MERLRPACRGSWYGTDRSAGAHEAHHHFPDPHGEALHCPGWTAGQQGASVLADRLDQVARDHLPPLKMPAGIRLECHPLVVRELQMQFIPSFAEFSASLATGEDPVRPQIPVTVTAGMGRGQWRITADGGLIAEGVIDGG